ncbi:hypothetical protein CR513_59894, partial [Mucuna pruriens]
MCTFNSMLIDVRLVAPFMMSSNSNSFHCNITQSCKSGNLNFYSTWHARLKHASFEIVSLILKNCNIFTKIIKTMLVSTAIFINHTNYLLKTQ